MSKLLLFGKEARDKILVGVEAVANLVSSTLGPRGRTVIIERQVTNDATKQVVHLSPIITKDGVSVSRAVSLADQTANLGCDLIREAAQRSVQDSGDGTTTAVVLGHALIAGGMKAIDKGHSPVFLRLGIEKAVTQVVELISAMSIPAEGREGQIARIACNGDEEIGSIVVDAITQAGDNGLVSVDSSRTGKNYIEFSAGMRLESGLRYSDFITNAERGEAVLENPYILLHERRIGNIKTIEKLLTAVAASGRPLLILSEEFEVPVIGLLLANIDRLKTCPVIAPYFGDRRREFMKDLAVLTRGVSITDELGIDLKNVGLEVLGEAERVVVSKNFTTIVGGKGDKVEIALRVEFLQNALKATDNAYEQEVFSERLARIDGGIAIIHIGGATETESKERRDRCEDSVLAVKCAKQEGIVPGGGICLLRCSESKSLNAFVNNLPPEERVGGELVLQALEAPIRQILANGGYSARKVLSEPSFWGTHGGV